MSVSDSTLQLWLYCSTCVTFLCLQVNTNWLSNSNCSVLAKSQILRINWFFDAGMCAGSVSSMACGTQESALAQFLTTQHNKMIFETHLVISMFFVVSQKIIAVKYCKYHVSMHRYSRSPVG